MKHYLYRHIRKDKDEPFYIGIGTKSKVKTGFKTYESEYSRAFSFTKKARRNKIWRDIFNKTDVEVEILFESNDYEEIKNKEQEFIGVYGRIDSKTGILSNMTNGGDGTIGYYPSEQTKQRQRENSALHGKYGYDNHLSKEVHVYNLDGSFIQSYGSGSVCSKALNVDVSGIYQCLISKIKSCNGFVFSREYLGAKISRTDKPGAWKKKEVLQVDMSGNIIMEYESVTKAARVVGTQTTNISKACLNKKSIIKGYKWRYKVDIESGQS